MATAQEVIEGSLRLIGQLAQGETADADSLADGLTALNQMLDSWSTESLSIYALQDQTFTWTANERMRTVGPSGNFVGTRPVAVHTSTYFKINNLSYPFSFVNADQYNGIALKTNTATYPLVMYVNMTMPDAELYVYPVPTSSFELHLISVEELTQPATLSTSLVIPPGYLRAFRYNLGVEVASEFGIEAPQNVKRIAELSKRNIKRINNPDVLMSMPFAMIGRRRNTFNVFSGLPM